MPPQAQPRRRKPKAAGPELNVQGVGPTLGAAFAEAALAVIGLVADTAAVRLEETIEIECNARSAERLLAEWLKAVLSEMAARRIVFGAFNVETDGFDLHATARGERISSERRVPLLQIKSARFKDLTAGEDLEGEWRVQCIVDFPGAQTVL
jgi:SHS2 domain-containing protein